MLASGQWTCHLPPGPFLNHMRATAALALPLDMAVIAISSEQPSLFPAIPACLLPGHGIWKAYEAPPGLRSPMTKIR